MEKTEKIFLYKGKNYSSYYQLEKVMNISRRTIQYRHEVKGIPLDEVPNFVPEPPEKRFGEKVYFPNARKEKEASNIKDELERIITYPKRPSIYIGEEMEREDDSISNYNKWVQDAPITLIKRELHQCEEELKRLVEQEKGKYFYGTETHDIEKRVIERQVGSIKNILKEGK